MVSAARHKLIGPRVRARRLSLSLTQAALAQRAGISTSYLNLIENNKRPVAGRLQIALAAALDIELSALSGEAENQLAEALSVAATDPVLGDPTLDPTSAADLVGRHPGWAQLAVRAVAAYQEQAALTVALTDRLAHDPAIASAVHQMLTNIAAIRSTAEILTTVDDLSADRQARFHAIIDEQARALSDVSMTLAAVFDPTTAELRPVTPLDFVEDAFARRNNRLPGLENAVTQLRRRMDVDKGACGPALDAALAKQCAAIGLKLDRPGGITAQSTSSASSISANRIQLPRTAPPAANRRTLALKLVERALAHQIMQEINHGHTPEKKAATGGRASNPAPAAHTAHALDDIRNAFAQYAADALLMPYVAFLADALQSRFDIMALAAAYDVEVDAVARRLTSLGGDAVPPFALLAVTPAGARIDRRRTADIAMPRFGAGCALWAAHHAFTHSDGPIAQHVEMPSGERLLFFAAAAIAPAEQPGRPPRSRAYMLATPAIHADSIVYADVLPAKAPPIPIGITCELCPRTACAHRAVEPTLAATP